MGAAPQIGAEIQAPGVEAEATVIDQPSISVPNAKPNAAVPEPLLDAKEVAAWLHTSEDWVWDHSTRRAPYLPAIWLSDGMLRFRPSKIEEYIEERERLSLVRGNRRKREYNAGRPNCSRHRTKE
jgi:predicted DNA-binding transcriptional regulator AlpA